ncbi:MAG: Holliday junction branch migration protein RuvA [Christensenellales bacterium]|jgi:Holliday junction DNA helicase RuvA
MIASVRGIILSKSTDTIVMEAHGLGLEVQVGLQTLSRLPEKGKEAFLYTVLNVREDSFLLYGFDNDEDKKMFLRLIGVSGVGPKLAMNILSTMPARELAIALVSEDSRAIARVPGIGKKIAERLILELKEKVENSFFAGDTSMVPIAVLSDIITEDAIAALIALGYSSTEAAKAVQQNRSSCSAVEDLIRAALRSLSKGR